MPYVFCLRIHPDLHEVVADAAEAANLPMNEYIAQILATHLKCPELGVIPRKPYTRPRHKKNQRKQAV